MIRPPRRGDFALRGILARWPVDARKSCELRISLGSTACAILDSRTAKGARYIASSRRLGLRSFHPVVVPAEHHGTEVPVVPTVCEITPDPDAPMTSAPRTKNLRSARKSRRLPTAMPAATQGPIEVAAPATGAEPGADGNRSR